LKTFDSRSQLAQHAEAFYPVQKVHFQKTMKSNEDIDVGLLRLHTGQVDSPMKA
jgi:hypothetical protein